MCNSTEYALEWSCQCIQNDRYARICLRGKMRQPTRTYPCTDGTRRDLAILELVYQTELFIIFWPNTFSRIFFVQDRELALASNYITNCSPAFFSVGKINIFTRRSIENNEHAFISYRQSFVTTSSVEQRYAYPTSFCRSALRTNVSTTNHSRLSKVWLS